MAAQTPSAGAVACPVPTLHGALVHCPDWSMKYVPLETEVNCVLKRHDVVEFDPYRFNVPMIEDMIELLVGSRAPEQAPDRAAGAKKGPLAVLKRWLGGG